MKSVASLLQFILLFGLVLILSLSCSGKSDSSNEQQLPQQQEQEAIKKYVQALDPVQRYSQLFLVNLEGNKEFYPVEKFQWGTETPSQDLIPGGYLFFSFNIAPTPQEVAAFTASIQTWCHSRGVVPPLLTLDQEGGSVSRLRSITSVLPSAGRVAQAVLSKSTPQFDLVQQLYASQAAQMKLLGFHMNLAPVAEATNRYNKDFLGSRSYGELPYMEDFAISAIEAFQSQGLAAVAKHFPGNTNDDPHTGLPEINLSQEDFQNLYLDPFQRVLTSGKPWALLMSHVMTAAHKTPACLSHFWVTETLRQQFGYQGLILSDDIFMAALEKNGFPPERAVVMAVEAGVDVIMLSEKKFSSVLKLLLDKSQEDLEFRSLLDRAAERVITAKIQTGLLGFQEGEGGLSLVPSPLQAWDETTFQKEFQRGQEVYKSLFGE